MKKNMKKGFTITELVIVIAVIAVLAAVMIPTFASIVKKAKQSADQQAVTTMNKVLSVETDTPDSISEVIALLAEESLDIEDYKPLTKDTYFYWVKSENAIVIANSSNEVVYPKDLTDITKSAGDWYTLSGETPEDNSWVENVTAEGKVDIATGEQFVSLMKEVVDGNKANAVNTVNLTGDVDLMGSTINFGIVKKDLTIAGNGNKIYGLRSDSNSIWGGGDFANTGYAYGMIPNVAAGKTVTVKGITIANVVVDDTTNLEAKMLGVIAGSVSGTLIIEDVTLENCYIEGEQRVGALVGNIYEGGKVELKGNITVKNTTVATDIQGAALIGTIRPTGSFVNSATVKVENVSVIRRAKSVENYEVANLTLEGATAGDVFVKDKKTGWYWAATTNNYYWVNVSKAEYSLCDKDNCLVNGSITCDYDHVISGSANSVTGTK